MTEVEIFKQSLDVSRIVMLITILMAVTSVVFSALTMAFERSHNKRSIKPFCNLVASINDDMTTLKIKNAGMGTMILKTIKLLSGLSQELDLPEFRGRYPGLVIDMLNIKHETALSIDEEIEILNIGSSVDKEVLEEISECKIVIMYSDMYNQDYEKELKIGEIGSCALTIASTMATRPGTETAR